VIADHTAYDVRYAGKLSDLFCLHVTEGTNRDLPARNTLVHLLALYTDPGSPS